MGSRRIFTREFKQSVIQQLAIRSAVEICREHDLHPNMLIRWKKEYELSPEEAFKGHGKLCHETAKIERYERLIGQLYAEIDLLKKNIEIQRQLKAEENRRRQIIK